MCDIKRSNQIDGFAMAPHYSGAPNTMTLNRDKVLFYH